MKTEETRELEKLLGIGDDAGDQEIPIITSYADAEKAMDTYAAANERIFERTQFVKNRIEIVMKRLEQLNAEDEKKKGDVSGLLKEWGSEFIKKAKQKTVKFMRGKISFKDVAEGLVIDEPDTVVGEIMDKRGNKEFSGKHGTVPLKVKISFQEPEGAEAAAMVQKATEEYIDKIIDASPVVKTEVGQREVAAFYKKTAYIFEGSHIRPKLENASFKIESDVQEIANGKGQGEIDGG